MATAPNWAEQTTAIATAVGALGLLGAIVAAAYADRELDYFEQLATLEQRGAFDFELIKLLLGRILVERWETWKPAIEVARGVGVYPQFEALAAKMRRALAQPS